MLQDLQLRSTGCPLLKLKRSVYLVEKSHLMYVEDMSKNHPGGLKGRKIKPKVVYHHANTDKLNQRMIAGIKINQLVTTN